MSSLDLPRIIQLEEGWNDEIKPKVSYGYFNVVHR